MTLVAYFNALRELGSARRIAEDEIRTRLGGYGQRRRINDGTGRLSDRPMRDPLELTSRVGTTEVADAKQRLGQELVEPSSVDLALATNMISVGLDVIRLGLMLVAGQPKTAAEYIQATSRVGRDPARPGLVVALLNLAKPRDRSHYERFAHWHAGFYRSVEAVSVTPFAPRALDRGLAAVVVALARLGRDELTPTNAAGAMDQARSSLNAVLDAISGRAAVPPSRVQQLRHKVMSLLDGWAALAHERKRDGTAFGYSLTRGIAKPLLHEMIDRDLALADPREQRFRAPRSLRDVEPQVLLRRTTPNGVTIKTGEP